SGLSRRAADDHARLLLPASFFSLAPRRALTRMLLVPEQVEFVPRRRLHGHAEIADPPASRSGGRPRQVGHVCVLSGDAGVEVRVHPWHGAIAALFTHVQEIPQAILPDRTADAAGEIPQLQEIARRAQTAVFEILRVVAADHAAAD